MSDDEDENEARASIASGYRFGGDGFVSYHDATAFVDGLYAAGATLVMVTSKSSVIVATLPVDPEARARLFAIYNAEVDRFGEDFGGEDTPGHELTREEALALGHPDAEGEWCVDDLHAVDTGQVALHFWWD